MKKKKQTRKIKQWLAAALGLTLLGTGLWAGMNGEKLQAKPQTTDFQNISLEPKVAGWPFLSQGVLGDGSTPKSVWQNIETATIPAENSLVFKNPFAGEADMSKIRSSGLDFEAYPINKGRVATYKLSPDPQWLEIDDVGYYQGKRIGLRVIVQLINPPSSIPTTPLPNGKTPSMQEAFMGYAGGYFAIVSVPSWLSNGANVTYEVYDVNDSTREAIPFSGYFPLSPHYESTRISILNWTQIVDSENHIYSASATSTPRTQVQYQLQENVLTLARDLLIDGDGNSVFTFTNQASLRFRLFSVFEDNTPWKENDALDYNLNTAMRIAIPNPEPLEVSDVKEIKADTEMDYQFNQQIPPEPTSKRDQRIQWTLKTDDNKTVVPDVEASGTLKSWIVSDLDGNDMTSKFEVTSFNESTNEVTIAPKEAQYTEDSFYNHYYTFKSKLKIDYTKPIDESLLVERDGGKYLDKTGTVTLAVNGVAREEQEFKTSINFASTVNYAYLVQGTSTAVPGFTPTAEQKTGDGIITHAAALTPPSPIGTANKYQYVSVEPANKIIKYSTQDMKFYYVEDTEPWLPFYKPGGVIGGGGWLDSMESYIPRSNAFVMQYLPGKTKLVDKSEGVLVGTHPTTGGNPAQEWAIKTDQPQYVKYENVGYYDGDMLTVKMTITPNKPSGQDELLRSYIYFEGPYFLSNAVDSKCEGASLSFEFYNSAGKEVTVQSYLPLIEQWNRWTTQVSTQEIQNIYSVSRQYHYQEKSAPVLIQYKENKQTNFLEFLGTVDAAIYTGVEPIQQSLTMTVNKFPVIKYDVTELGKMRTAVGFGLVNQSEVKVEIPDPQATTQTYTEIIGEDKGITGNQMIDSLDYGFIQQMPWESQAPKDNRTQIPTWTLGAPAGNATVVPSDKWKVQSQDDPTLGDGDVYNWFTAEDNTLTPEGGLNGKLADDEFYNHYYKFNRSLNIDYNNPIARTSLNAKDGRYYFDYSGKVDLAVDDTNPTPEQKAGMNKNRKKVNYDTAINFYAPLEYKYVNSVTGAEIPAGSLPTSAKLVGDGIVTWDAPLTPQQLTDESYTQDTGQGDAPAIAGYAFDHSELNGSKTNTQIKVTKLLRKKTEAEEDAGQTVDDTNPANYTQNNVVTLYYTPLTYQVGITVKDSKEGEVLSSTETNPSAATHFQAAVVASKGADGWEDTPTAQIDWKPLSEIDFTALDKKYQIRQVSLVKEGYDWDKVTNGSPSNPSPKFWVELATNNETTKYQVKLETGSTLDPDDPYTNHGYLFPATLTVSGEGATQTRALPLTVINKPIGELKLPTLDPIHFGTDQIKDKDGKTIEGVSLPRSTGETMIQRSSTSTNWKIKVEDERLQPYQTGGWKLEATMMEDFTWTDPTDPTRKSVISNLLVFCPDDKTFAEVSATPMGVGSTVVIKKFDTDTKEMTWAADKGFLLKVDQAKQNEIMAKGTDGNKYEAELEFVLTADPLLEPGK